VKVLVATSDVPFVEGGHRVIANALVDALHRSGYEAEILTTPTNRFGRQFASYTATRLTDVEFTGAGYKTDQLISLRFPSYALYHPRHVCWLNHRMREYYDLWPEWSGALKWKGRIKEGIRKKLIHAADNYFLKRNVDKVFAQSENVRTQLHQWGKIPSEVLYPPPPHQDYYTEEYGDFILSPARLTPLKRIPLLVEALAQTKNGKAIIVGDGPDRASILERIRAHSLENRVQWTGHVSSEELKRLYATCRAVYYAPRNEDYGLVTLEAFHSRKPVLTAVDSGGPAELVHHNINGFSVEPEASGLASCMTVLFEDKALAERMGTAGFEEWKKINWNDTVNRLIHFDK